MREGGGTEKTGGEKEILKRGSTLNQGVGTLKGEGGGGWKPLTNYTKIEHTS